ncbi:MAG: tyrosine-type recombinase/integrase [Actinomycetota bacterium]|nr:tyrosine-type recombinase/integrase [Actinomycetota bacterium]
MAERELAASPSTLPGSDALVADGTRAVAPAILAPPEVPGPGRPRDENPVLAYLARLSPGSKRTMRASLETIARLASAGAVGALGFPWWLLRYQHAEAIRGRLVEAYAPATANKMLSAMKGVLKSSWRLGLMTADERDRASDVEPVRGTRLPPGRSIPRGELRALFEACAAEANDPKMRARGVRDAAMLALLYVGGLRRAELASLKLSDYDSETRTVRIRGKGNKERQVYAEGGADLLLSAWLELRGEGGPSDPLFLPVRKDGLVQHRDPQGEKKASLSDQAVYKVVKRRHREAKIKEVSPHDFRKTFVGDLLDAIGDLSTVQKLAGHSDPATTARYDRRGERAMREAASHLHVPHFGD